MVQFSSVLFAQIRFLVANLYKKIAKNNIAELNHVRARLLPRPRPRSVFARTFPPLPRACVTTLSLPMLGAE